METLIIILGITMLAAALAIRHYQVRAKHALNHYNFERGKHEEYKRAYYAKGDELEQLHTLHEMAKFDKKQALRKAAESNKHVLELQNKNAGLKVEADNLRAQLKEQKRLYDILNEARNEALRKVGETNAKCAELQDSLEVAKAEREVKNMQKQQTEKQLQELGTKYTQQAKALSAANETIKEVHKLLNSGAKGKETMAALVITGEYLKVQKNN